MNEITISIIIPVYNVEQYLEQCLESVVQQTVKPSEVILINDGSTDNSRDICEKYCKKYHYFYLFNQKNYGQAVARNVGIKLSKMEYILFVDSDDYVSSKLVETVKKGINESRYDMYLFSANIQYDIPNGEPKYSFIRLEECNNVVLSGKEYLQRTYPVRHIETVYQAAYRRSFILENDLFFPEGIYFEDSLFSLKTLLNANRVLAVEEKLYVRRYREGSTISSEMSIKKAYDLMDLNRYIWDYLISYGVEQLSEKFVMDIISGYLLHTWNKISSLDNNKEIQESLCNLFQEFLMRWEKLYNEKSRNLGDEILLFLASKICEKNDRGQKETLENMIYNKLKELPLSDSSKNIFIYGIGLNANALLGLYRKYVEPVKASIDYIITDTSNRTIEFDGKKVYSSKEVKDIEMDNIIISSRAYQEDMYEVLIHNGIDANKIVCIYGGNDVCDLAIISEILS